MITIIEGTNRPDSMTHKVAIFYQKVLLEKNIDTKLLSLQNRNVWERGEEMTAIENEYLADADKFIFILPEYNGSFPGILKLMIDNSNVKKCWSFKKGLLIGLSQGRFGNVRGIDHITSILNYMKMNVFHSKLILSSINEEMDNNGHILKQETEQRIKNQINDFLQF